MFRNWMTKRIKYVCWRWGRSTSNLEKGERMSSEIKLNLVACLCIFVAIIFVIMLVLFDKKNWMKCFKYKKYMSIYDFRLNNQNEKN